jgi:hypothetical protein
LLAQRRWSDDAPAKAGAHHGLAFLSPRRNLQSSAA